MPTHCMTTDLPADGLFGFAATPDVCDRFASVARDVCSGRDDDDLLEDEDDDLFEDDDDDLLDDEDEDDDDLLDDDDEDDDDDLFEDDGDS